MKPMQRANLHVQEMEDRVSWLGPSQPRTVLEIPSLESVNRSIWYFYPKGLHDVRRAISRTTSAETRVVCIEVVIQIVSTSYLPFTCI